MSIEEGVFRSWRGDTRYMVGLHILSNEYRYNNEQDVQLKHLCDSSM